MTPKHDHSLPAKEAALLALAHGDPDFPAFLDQYQQALPQAAVPAELVEELMAAVKEEPHWENQAKSLEENAQAAQTYGVLGIPEMIVLLAGLFLLSTRIKIHRTQEGKWEFLVEHRSTPSAHLEKIAQMLTSLFRS